MKNLKVIDLVKRTDDCQSIRLEKPSDFHYQSGQHLPISLNINGESIKRCYTLSSCPDSEDFLEITVKRVPNGRASNYLNDLRSKGGFIEAEKPNGRFYIQTEKGNYKSYYLICAGSGITPMYSMIKNILRNEPLAKIHLLYGNKNQSSIIFKDELNQLTEQNSDRLTVTYALSEPYSDWQSLWNNFKGKHGRINEDNVTWFIQNHRPIAQTTEYKICGPGTMNRDVKKILLGLEIPANLISYEAFGSLGEIPVENDSIVENATLLVAGNQLSIDSGDSILKTLKKNQVACQYSCESGICGSCVADLKSGKVHLNNNMALDDDDIEKGKILTCQAYPLSSQIEIELPND